MRNESLSIFVVLKRVSILRSYVVYNHCHFLVFTAVTMTSFSAHVEASLLRGRITFVMWLVSCLRFADWLNC